MGHDHDRGRVLIGGIGRCLCQREIAGIRIEPEARHRIAQVVGRVDKAAQRGIDCNRDGLGVGGVGGGSCGIDRCRGRACGEVDDVCGYGRVQGIRNIHVFAAWIDGHCLRLIAGFERPVDQVVQLAAAQDAVTNQLIRSEVSDVDKPVSWIGGDGSRLDAGLIGAADGGR
jgi:hypothetical protein